MATLALGADLVRKADALLTRAADAVTRVPPAASPIDDEPSGSSALAASIAGEAPPEVLDLAPRLDVMLDVLHARLYGRAGTMLIRADRALNQHLLDAFA
jgi:hypothetical protein